MKYIIFLLTEHFNEHVSTQSVGGKIPKTFFYHNTWKIVTSALFTLKFLPKSKWLNQLQLNNSHQLYVSNETFFISKFELSHFQIQSIRGGEGIKELIIQHNILNSPTC